MQVGKSAFYEWNSRPPTLTAAVDLHLHRRAKELFHANRDSLYSRELAKKLRKEGITISREKTRKLMKKLNLVDKERVACKVTTKRKHGGQVAEIC
jgi:putative transposase